MSGFSSGELAQMEQGAKNRAEHKLLEEEIMSKWAKGELVEAEQIFKELARLRVGRAYGLTGFYFNNKKKGKKEYNVILTKEDKGYFQALDDIEESLLGGERKEKTDDEIH